jgi:hypothetical protein
MSSDSHNPWVEIDDSDEADFLIQDEISFFKTMCNFVYLNSLDSDKFMKGVQNFLQTEKLGSYSIFIKKFEEVFNLSGQINDNLLLPLNQFNYYMNNEKVARLKCVSKSN